MPSKCLSEPTSPSNTIHALKKAERFQLKTDTLMPSKCLSEPTSPSNTIHALKKAERFCEKKGLKLTLLRKQVLEIIWDSEKPIGAYSIMSELELVSDRTRVAPPTVYRTLEFLLNLGLIHRIHSINAFVGRSNTAGIASCETLFICRDCGTAQEVLNTVMQQTINLTANEMKFQVENQALEILGICQTCRKSSVLQ